MCIQLRLLLGIILLFVSLTVMAGKADDSTFNEIQLQLGNLLIAEERFNEAIEAFTLAKRGTPTVNQLFRARQGAVMSMLRLARFGEAHDEAILAYSAAPDNSSAVALYGDALWARGLFGEAEEAYQTALVFDPEDGRGHHGLAKALITRGRLSEAMDAAQTALRYLPRDPELHHTVGAIYERMQRFEESAIAFGNYVNLLPAKHRSARAAWSRSQIRFLRSFGNRTPFKMPPGSSDQLYTVPFKLVREKIVVRAKVNGGREIDFVVDTGAEQTVLSQEVARRQRVQPVVYTLSAGVGEVGFRGLQLARIDTLQIGSLVIENVPSLIKNPPLGGMPRRETESFSPLAAGLSIRIDYDRQRLTLGRHLDASQADVELPLRVHRLATVRGKINNERDASFVVDTGGEVISLSAAAASTIETQPMTRSFPLKVYGSSGWDSEAFLLPGVNLMFNSISFNNYPVVVLNLHAPSALLGFELGGIIGHDFLKRYLVDFDLDKSVIRLAHRSSAAVVSD